MAYTIHNKNLCLIRKIWTDLVDNRDMVCQFYREFTTGNGVFYSVYHIIFLIVLESYSLTLVLIRSFISYNIAEDRVQIEHLAS